MLPGLDPRMLTATAKAQWPVVTLVAGSTGYGDYGYHDGSMSSDGYTKGGSISAEPIPGETLTTLAHDPAGGGSFLLFAGDIRALLAGLTLYVDGNAYSLGTPTLTSGRTLESWSNFTGPQLANGNSHQVWFEEV